MLQRRRLLVLIGTVSALIWLYSGVFIQRSEQSGIVKEDARTRDVKTTRKGSNLRKKLDNHPFISNNSHSRYPLTWTSLGDETNNAPTFNFISAYYDNRLNTGPSIVVLGYELRSNINSPIHCLVYANGEKHCLKEPSLRVPMDPCNVFKESKRGDLYRYIHVFHICNLLPSASKVVPIAVGMSVGSSTCSRHSFPFIPVYDYSRHASMAKGDIGLCVQTPVYETDFDALVSFVEMYKILGVDLFTMYYVSSNFTRQMMDLLWNIYSDVFDIIEWNPLFTVDTHVLHYNGQILAINDCLYRNIGRVKYLIFVDLDELIVPRKHENLKEMLKELDAAHLDSFVFLNVLYLESKVFSLKQKVTEMSKKLCCNRKLPKYLHHFNQVDCHFDYFSRSKLIIKPSLVSDMDIHNVCKRISNTTTHLLIPLQMGSTYHYRARPTTECHKNPQSHTYDAFIDTTVMDKYGIELIHSINREMQVEGP